MRSYSTVLSLRKSLILRNAANRFLFLSNPRGRGIYHMEDYNVLLVSLVVYSVPVQYPTWLPRVRSYSTNPPRYHFLAPSKCSYRLSLPETPPFGELGSD
jgi:hypothetical protein